MKTEIIQWPEKEPSVFKLIFTLTIAGLLSGLAIVSIYQFTLPIITAYKIKVLQEAVFKVLPGTTNFEKLQDNEKTIYVGYDNKATLIGYAIPAEGAGYQDTIRLIYGYEPNKRLIIGMEILDSKETPGLGDRIYKDADFRANFKELSVETKLVLVKKGNKHAPNEVDAISGATISSKAVVRILNNANEKCQLCKTISK
jgi:electron transport complex protein RnfG